MNRHWWVDFQPCSSKVQPGEMKICTQYLQDPLAYMKDMMSSDLCQHLKGRCSLCNSGWSESRPACAVQWTRILATETPDPLHCRHTLDIFLAAGVPFRLPNHWEFVGPQFNKWQTDMCCTLHPDDKCSNADGTRCRWKHSVMGTDYLNTTIVAIL